MKIKQKKLFIAYLSFSVVISALIILGYGKSIFFEKENVLKCDYNKQRLGEIYIAEFKVSSRSDAKILIENCFDISGVVNDIVTVYITEAELNKLYDMGFKPKIIDSQPKPLWREDLNRGSKTSYNTYDSLEKKMKDFNFKYPNLTMLKSIGDSVRGRKLWAIKITDNPNIEEDEPEVKLVATIHGDEPVGTELCLKFIEMLLEGYEKDTRIRNLIDSTEIWIMPLMNPDGFEMGTRYNAARYDLNRNFPENSSASLSNLQPEVFHVINWSLENSFVLSANFHTGAVVVNYPYDYDGTYYSSYAPTSDDDLFIEISKIYSFNNKPMWGSNIFPDGITNGADWYVIRGGMQDWNYRVAGSNEVTLEVAVPKAPHSSNLARLWEENRESMLSYLETVHIGLRGLVLDRFTRKPLSARIVVDDRDQVVRTDPDVGDYHRMLLPGKYNIKVSAEGYKSLTVNDIIVGSSKATRIDVALEPL